MRGLNARSVRRGVALFWALLSVSLGGSGAQAAPVSARLMELLASDAGLGLLRESTAGNELVSRLLGRRLTGARDDARDVGSLRARLELADADQLQVELQARLERAESEFESQRKMRPMSPAERGQLLEELSSRWLRIRVNASGSIEFVELTAGAGSYAASREAMAGLRLAPTSLGATLESAIPVEPGSMTASLGAQLYDELIGIENRFLFQNGLDSAEGIAQAVGGGTNAPVTLKDMLEYVVAERQKMSAELLRLEAQYRPADRLLADTLDKAAHEVGLSQHSLHKIEAKAPALAAVPFTGGESADEILDYVHKLFGEMGELKVAVRVNGLVGRGSRSRTWARFSAEGRLLMPPARVLWRSSRNTLSTWARSWI